VGRPRSDLQTILTGLLPTGQKAYFQPPATVQMTYPCIVYERDQMQVTRANNAAYNRTNRYTVTVIDRDPDSDIPGKVAALPLTRYVRSFRADDLNHEVFILYF
jgi:hypothetical protein